MLQAHTVLVIGVHREELAFGERVAAGLSDLDLAVYRIPHGITGRRPRQDQVFRYRLYHEELYLQLRQQLKDSTHLLIDLHAGQDSQGPAADLFCCDQALLDCIGATSANGRRFSTDARVRMIPLVDSGPDETSDLASDVAPSPVAHAMIPRRIWRHQPPLYLAIECYLRELGPGAPRDWALASELIRRVVECHQERAASSGDSSATRAGG